MSQITNRSLSTRRKQTWILAQKIDEITTVKKDWRILREFERFSMLRLDKDWQKFREMEFPLLQLWNDENYVNSKAQNIAENESNRKQVVKYT